MTILRLASGELLLYSPVQFSEELKRSVGKLGPVRHLIAPSIGHWMFVQDWQRACPEAKTWAVSGLRDRSQVRASGLRIDEELGSVPPDVWVDELDQVLIRGAVFAEVALFHKATRTLLISDLVLNLEPDKLPVPARAVGSLLGVLAPNGRAPVYLRILLRINRREASQAAARLVAFAPERVIFAHGRWFDRNATARLRRSLDWLLGGSGRGVKIIDNQRLPSAGTLIAAAAVVGLIGLAVVLRMRARAAGSLSGLRSRHSQHRRR
jgi:hypothetical protein